VLRLEALREDELNSLEEVVSRAVRVDPSKGERPWTWLPMRKVCCRLLTECARCSSMCVVRMPAFRRKGLA
jgi:hypothetical protein